MASSAHPEQTTNESESLTSGKRILFFVLVICIQVIYIPTSSRSSGGVEPVLPIDIFPIWSIWVIPYLLCYLLWFLGGIWIVLKMEDRLFRAFIMACLLTFTFGVSTFVFFPTYVKPGVFAGNDIFTLLLRIIHEDLGRYDAFPSGHIYITTLMASFFTRWYPRRKLLWISILVIVALSTLFTGQHYILDVIGGYSLALIGYHFGLWRMGFYPTQKRASRGPGKRVASSLN